MKKRKFAYKKLLFLVPLLVIVSLGTYTLAKYVIEEFHSYYLNAKNFYFTSNRLKKTTATYLVNNWSGVGSFDISFDLSLEKNSYVYADYDIPYTVTFNCPTGVTCTLDKPSGTIYHESETRSDKVTLSVNPSRVYNENEVLQIYIEASSVSPYVETLSANFEYVVGKQGVTYEIEDEANRPYMLFKITNAINYCRVIQAFGDYEVGRLLDVSIYRTLSATDKAKCIGENVMLSFNPSVIVLDTTSDIAHTATTSTTNINGTAYISSLGFYIEPSSTVAIKFYKANPAANYTYPLNNNSSIVTVSFPT